MFKLSNKSSQKVTKGHHSPSKRKYYLIIAFFMIIIGGIFTYYNRTAILKKISEQSIPFNLIESKSKVKSITNVPNMTDQQVQSSHYINLKYHGLILVKRMNQITLSSPKQPPKFLSRDDQQQLDKYLGRYKQIYHIYLNSVGSNRNGYYYVINITTISDNNYFNNIFFKVYMKNSILSTTKYMYQNKSAAPILTIDPKQSVNDDGISSFNYELNRIKDMLLNIRGQYSSTSKTLTAIKTVNNQVTNFDSSSIAPLDNLLKHGNNDFYSLDLVNISYQDIPNQTVFTIGEGDLTGKYYYELFYNRNSKKFTKMRKVDYFE